LAIGPIDRAGHLQPGSGAAQAGSLLVSNLLAEPNYDVMLAWDLNTMPAGLGGDPPMLLRI
jgi:hypothetical protein